MKKLLLTIAGWFFRRRRPILEAEIRTILVVKLCCIGDYFFTTPLLRALAVNYPAARITYMVGSWGRELVAADPHVQQIITFDAYGRQGFWQKLRRIWTAVREIRRNRFDVAFILHRTPLAGLMAAAGGVRLRIGFDWEGSGFSLTHPVPFRPQAHEIDRNLDCLKALGAGPQGIDTEFTPPASASEAASAFLKQHGWEHDSRPLIAVFPGGGVNPGTIMTSKRWPVAGYRALCEQLVEHCQARILLVGNTQDQAIGDELLEAQTFASHVIRAEARTDLLMLAGLLKQCRLFIGGDSGPLHIAAAVGTPTVALFGPTDEKLLAPRGPQHRVVRKILKCTPCFTAAKRQGDAVACSLGTVQCMQAIKVHDVMKAAEIVLAGPRV